MKNFNIYDNKTLYGLNKTSAIFNKLKNGIEDNRDPIYEICSHMSDFESSSLEEQLKVATEICEKMYHKSIDKLYPNQVLDVWRLFNVEPDLNKFCQLTGFKLTQIDMDHISQWIWRWENKVRVNQG